MKSAAPQIAKDLTGMVKNTVKRSTVAYNTWRQSKQPGMGML